MRIERILIDGYGRFSQREIGPLGPGLTVICGPNESGKSTLQRFISTILFGFPRRNAEGWIEPLAGGRLGGRLELRDERGAPVIVERHHDGRKQQTLITLPDGSIGDEDDLDSLLSGISRSTYERVFGLDLDDLQSFDGLPQTEVSSRIYGAGLGAERAPDLLAELEREAGKLFKPAGRVQPVAKLFDELAEVERSLAAVRRDLERYPALLNAQAEVGRKIEVYSERIDGWRRQLASLDEARRKRTEVDRRIAALGPGWDRSRLLAMDGLDADLTTVREFNRDFTHLSLRLEAVERSVDDAPVDVFDRSRLERIDAARTAWSAYQRIELPDRIDGPARYWLAGVLLATGMAALIVGAITDLVWLPVVGVLLVVGAIGLFVKRRGGSRGSQQARMAAWRSYVQLAREAGVDPRSGVAGLEQARAKLLSGRQIHQQANEDRSRLRADLAGRRDEWRVWLDERGLPEDLDPDAAEELIRELLQAREAVLIEQEARTDLPPASDLASAIQHLLDQIDDQERERAGLHEQLGEIRQQVGLLESEDRDRQLRSTRAGQITELNRLGREWAKLTVARGLLEQTIQRFEEQHQPALVREAGQLLSAITDGAYQRIGVSLGDQRDIAVISHDGQRKSTGQLSRGTREQLYLALRFGLMRAHTARNESLPALLDDVLVNFDPRRAAAFAQAILDLARCQQVALFTCHPTTVDHFRGRGDPLVIELGGERRTLHYTQQEV